MSELVYYYYRVTPLEPLVARDTRPLLSGSHMHSLAWIPPSVLVGAVRTFLYKRGMKEPSSLKEIMVQGGFPIMDISTFSNGTQKESTEEKIYFPMPRDYLQGKETDGTGKKIYKIRPWNLPKQCGIYREEGTMLDTMLSSGFCFCAPTPVPAESMKPDKVDSYWSHSVIGEWLRDPQNEEFDLTKEKMGTLRSPSLDERVHVAIDSESRSAQKNGLFTSVALDLTYTQKKKKYAERSLSLRIVSDNKLDLPKEFIIPVGGDRHLAIFKQEQQQDFTLWKCPLEVKIKQGTGLRMVLATPAFFENGWCPDWVASDGTGTIPGSSIKVRLKGAVVSRWKPQSGWSYEEAAKGKRQKPLRRLVPEGSVYFFEVIENSKNEGIKDLWLNAACQSTQEKGKQEMRDGFGLALWGTWQMEEC